MVDAGSDSAARDVRAALDRSGLGLQVIRLSDSARSVQDAARALGCDPGAIVKSLVFRGERTGKPYLAEVSGSHRVNLALLTQAAGERAILAPPGFVLSQTGFPIGSVAPLGLRTPIAVFVDETLFAWEAVWVSAGDEHTMFRVAPAQLLQLTGGKSIRLAEPS